MRHPFRYLGLKLMAVALATLLWLIVATLRSVTQMFAAASTSTLPLLAVASAACLAIAAHALVDSFLTFTPTYTVFSLAAGILYAHRV